MSPSPLLQGEVKKWRVIVFTIVAGLLTLLLLYGGLGDLLLLDGQSGFPSAIHRWHEAQSGTFTALVFGGSLLALLWRPQHKPLVAQFVVLSIAIVSTCFATLTGTGFNPIVLVIAAAFIAVFVAAYPQPRALLHFRQEGSPSYPLLLLTLIAAIFLAPIIARELTWQILGMTAHDVHALNYHWITSVVLALMLILAGVLASTKGYGWQALGLISGFAYLYLGFAALLLPDYAGSWGMVGGTLGLLAGLSYIAITIVEARRRSKIVQESAVGTSA
ncbi:MAG TPA: hypothetical protein VF026_03005 [Ktedonobacteraceae bacterium]